MKKIFYPLLAAVMLLLTACPEMDPDNDDDFKNQSDFLQEKIEKIVPADLLKEIKDLGMPVYGGNNPPNIEGSYLLDSQTMKKSNVDGDDPVGTKYVDEIITLSNQNNDNFTITLKSEYEGHTGTFSMIISGNGENFTLYGNFTIEFDDGSKAKAVMIYSGKFKNGELHDLHFGEFVIDEPMSGLGHIMHEADKIAKKLGDSTIDDD